MSQANTAAAEIPPQPLPSIDSQGFWSNLQDNKITLQRCQSCREWQFPNLECCRHCAGELKFEPISGKGTLYTYIVEHHRIAPGFAGRFPYVIGLITPDEAPHIRIPSQIPNADPKTVKVGLKVKADIEPLKGGEHKIAVWKLV